MMNLDTNEMANKIVERSEKLNIDKKMREKMREILIDIDFKPNFKFFEKFAMKLYFIEKVLNIETEIHKVAETNKGVHIYIKIVKSQRILNPYDIVAIQLMLDSDYLRELFNLTRIHRWIDGDDLTIEWNTLFSRKYINKKLVSSEKFTSYSAEVYKVITKTLEYFRKNAVDEEKIKRLR